MEARHPYDRPDQGCCSSCYSAAERYTFPFLLWCSHSQRVVLVHGPGKWESWPVSPRELLDFATTPSIAA